MKSSHDIARRRLVLHASGGGFFFSSQRAENSHIAVRIVTVFHQQIEVIHIVGAHSQQVVVHAPPFLMRGERELFLESDAGVFHLSVRTAGLRSWTWMELWRDGAEAAREMGGSAAV